MIKLSSILVNTDKRSTVLVHSALEVNIDRGREMCPDFTQSRRHQELENKAAALKRELDIQKFSIQQYKDKVQQMHELLVSREEEHRYTFLSFYPSVFRSELTLKADFLE